MTDAAPLTGSRPVAGGAAPLTVPAVAGPPASAGRPGALSPATAGSPCVFEAALPSGAASASPAPIFPSTPDVGGGWHDESMPPFAPSAPMVGRDADLARVHALFARASDGTPTALLIEGEAGIGKSRLLREFAGDIANRADIHVGWCLDLGAARSPYGPLTAILRSIMQTLGDERVREAVGTGVDALAMLLPELAPQADRSTTSPERLRDAIASLIECAAERAPQILVIEDLHWADESTLAILSFLLRALSRGRIMLLLTCRSDDVRRGDAVSRFIGEATRARLLEREMLERLGIDAVRELAEQITGHALSDSALERIHDRAEGVPFFVEEIAGCSSAPIPDGLRDLLLARFDRLGDDARRVVQVASGAERPLTHPLLLQLVGFAEQRLDEAVREATRSGILVVVEDDYRFRHALLREAVHDDLLPGERSRLHRTYAETLEAQCDGSDTADAAALAYHWQLAQDDRKALMAAVEAMRQAKAQFAFASAARFGELALGLWSQVADPERAAGIARLDLLLLLGSILRNAGDGERALAVTDLALGELDPATVDPRLHARLLRNKSLYLVNLGRPGSIPLLEQSLSLFDGRIDDERLHASILNHLASRHMIAGAREAAIGLATEAADRAERAGSDDEVSVAANVRGACLMHLGDIEGGIREYEIARQRALGSTAELRYRVNFSDGLTLLGRYREAVRVAENGLARARALGVERTSGSIMRQNIAVALLELGEIEQVERMLEGQLAQSTLRVFRMYTTMTRVRVLSWRGRHQEAAELMEEWLPAFRETGEIERQIWYDAHTMRAAVAQSTGDPRGAMDVILGMLHDDGPALLHQRRLLLESGWFIADLRARGSDVAADIEAVCAAWLAQPETLRPGPWWEILDALLDPSADRLRQAMALADGDDVPALFRGVTRLELARVLVQSGDRAEAEQTACEAAEIAAALGHAQLERAVADFRSAAGLRGHSSRVDEQSDADALTARERQVLDLIAEGLSNRQIGERLFISVKTVSVHVSAVLRKLGVSTRTEAAVAAQRATPEARTTAEEHLTAAR
ncbi:Transcriptional regulatory protein LiaR [Microbacterium hydrocarbonoxydans]|uniref:Transcriptional regulatory protein LiaR n=1 Tax=Microbacterium hydrocarbonoxydans TaxID=273678 RepID=A0A0M2HVG3_9MICO|nr:Transcriptional regulatory protein LiaR [Microbacterium hydrocarbonoxydans]